MGGKCYACFGIPSQSQKLHLKGNLMAWQSLWVGVCSCRKWFFLLVARSLAHKWLLLFLTSVGVRHQLQVHLALRHCTLYLFSRVTSSFNPKRQRALLSKGHCHRHSEAQTLEIIVLTFSSQFIRNSPLQCTMFCRVVPVLPKCTILLMLVLK